MPTQTMQPTQAPVVFLDEFGYYFGRNDTLKEDLRKIDGVPNASYLVKDDGQVFVFDKLVQLVNEHRERHSDVPLTDLARGLIAEAAVSAKEAVTT